MPTAMRLTAFTDFGLRALMRLAAEPPGAVLATEALAEELAVSRHHLVKILQALAAAGFVRTLRGLRGGVALAMAPREIRMGEVVRRLERGQGPLVACLHADPQRACACTLLPACRLRGALAEAREAFYGSLDGLCLADCAVPRAAMRMPPAPPGDGGRRAS